MKISKFKFGRKFTLRAIAIVVCLVVVLIAYKAGYSGGVSHQKQQNTMQTQSTLLSKSRVSPSQVQYSSRGHFILVGTVETYNKKSISIKTKSNSTNTFAVTSHTLFVKKTGERVDPNQIKKGSSVVITADVETKGNFTATRIRIIN